MFLDCSAPTASVPGVSKKMPPKFSYQYFAFGYHATKNQLYKLSLSSSSVVSVDFTYFKLIGKKILGHL